jgi:SpoIID/LytB domain protein
MKKALIVVVMASLMAAGPAGPGLASKQFTFYGAGWGHGLGMSQYGAYGLALKGWGYKKIVRHFYTGTEVGTTPWSPSKLRIGLVQGKHTLHLQAVGGPVRLRVGSPTGAVVGGRAIAKGKTWQVQTRPSGAYRVLDASGQSVDGHLWGGPSSHLYATYTGAGARVYVAEAGNHYNRGHLELNLYKGQGCLSGWCERAVAVLTPQAYLYGLAEVPNSWPADARKAQAVAARTYAFEKAHRLGQHRSTCNCALYDDTWDQVYAGWDKEGAALGSRWVDAVDATQGQVVLHRGSLIQAYYHSSSGGHTENNELAWGGSPLSYLRGVCDPGDYVEGNPNRTWTVGPLSASTVATKLRPYTGGIGTVTGFSGITRGVSGQVLTLRVEGEKGAATISGTELAVGLGLKGDKVWINSNKLVIGEIRESYDSHLCAPGAVAGPRVKVPGGVRQRFERGRIYQNDARDRAYWLHGPVLSYFLDHGGASGGLGLPTSDVITKASGRTTTTFERGTVTCTKGGTCTQS